MASSDAIAALPEQSDLAAALPIDTARRYFVVNVVSNIAYMGLTTLAMAWYIPYLISHLGIAAYGMVPLANSLINYMSTITDGLNVSINRYLAIDLNRADKVASNRTFNTALYISLVAIGIMLPLAVALTWLFPIFFQVPVGLENQSRLLFGCVALTFLLTIVDSNFAVSTMILHRFDLRNLVRGLTMTTRMGTVVVLFALLPIQLWYIGLGFLLSALVSFAGNWQLWHRLTPHLKIRLAAVDRTRLSELLGLSGWAIVNRIGMLLFLSTDLMVINIYLGARITGWYGSLLLFPELLRSLVDTITSVLSPAITGRYAQHDFEGMKQLAIRSVKFMGIALALPVGLLCGFAQPFLNIWLGSDFQQFAVLLIALVGYLSITLATLPLAYVLTSYNKVRIQGIITLLLGVINLALSIIFVQWTGWGAIGVAASTAIVFIIKNLFFLSSYSAYVMRLRWWTFYVPLIVGAVGTLVVGLCSYGLTQIWLITNWSALASATFAVSLTYGFFAHFVLLDRKDRQLLVSLIPAPIRNLIERGIKV